MTESRNKDDLVVFLLGPTASGKTALALKLAKKLDVEIISVDSALVYTQMDVGTSKPSAEELASVPHHLIDIISPENAYSAADFRADALRLIKDIQSRGRVPLLVGGTMLYFRALEQGLSTLPSADEALRQMLEQELKEKGVQHMHERLAAIDPESAARIHPNDPQRITRAIEVYELSGKPMSVWWAEQQAQSFPYPLLKIGLAPVERAILHERIARRFEQMLQQGFVDEVKQLRENPMLNLDLPSMRCVGYRQVWQYLDGDFNYETMKDKGIAATRQLAKRQLTWMRSEKNLVLFDSEAPDLLDRVWKTIEAMDFN